MWLLACLCTTYFVMLETGAVACLPYLPAEWKSLPEWFWGKEGFQEREERSWVHNFMFFISQMICKGNTCRCTQKEDVSSCWWICKRIRHMTIFAGLLKDFKICSMFCIWYIEVLIVCQYTCAMSSHTWLLRSWTIIASSQ